jgi:hypothetical protein
VSGNVRDAVVVAVLGDVRADVGDAVVEDLG